MLLSCFPAEKGQQHLNLFGYLLQAEGNKLALTSLYALESTISQRKAELVDEENGKPSWTKRLLLNDKLLCSKIRWGI
jgi:hypothetical protein